MGGEEWVVMGLCVHECTPELTQDIDYLLSRWFVSVGFLSPNIPYVHTFLIFIHVEFE